MRKPLGHRTMAVAAADELRRRILEGEFPGGYQLRQDALANDLGVSRIPIREALVQLESEGLVKSVAHRGAVVSELSVDEIEELFALRALLEPRLLRLSVPHLTPDDFAALDRILAEYGAEMDSHDASRWGELNSALHMRLYERANQPRTAGIVASLLQGTDRYTRMQLSFTDGRPRAQDDHTKLVALCRAGRIDEAAAVLAAHIEDAGAALIGYIRQRQPGQK